MASSHLGAASLINASWKGLSSSVKSWVGFRNKLFRRYTVRRRFRVRQMCRKDQMTKRELVRLVKRSESLRRILKQYGIPVVDNPEERNESRRLSHLVCEEQLTNVPSSVLGDPHMRANQKLPDSSPEETRYETMKISDSCSGKKLLSFPHLKTHALVTILLPTIAFCTACILGAFRAKISRNSENPAAKTPRVHHRGSKRTRWRSLLGDRSEPQAADEQDSLPDQRVSLGEEEAPEEVCGGYSKVEREYQRFLSECGIIEHGHWRGGSSD